MSKKVVRFLCSVLSAMLFCGFCQPASARVYFNEAHFLESGLYEEGVRSVYSIVLSDGAFYAYLDDESVRALQEDGSLSFCCDLPPLQSSSGIFTEPEELESIVTHLTTDGRQLWGWNIHSGLAGTVDGDGIHWRDVRLQTGVLHPDGDFATFRVVKSYVAHDALYVFASLAEFQDEPGLALFRFDLSTGQEKHWEIPYAAGICRAGETSCYSLGLDASGWFLQQVDTETGKISYVRSDLSAFTAEDVLCGLTYREESNELFFACGGYLYSMIPGGKAAAAGSVSTSGCTSDSEAWLLSGSRYALCTMFGLQIADLGSDSGEASRLTVQGNSNYKTKLLYQSQYPDTVLTDIAEEISTDALATKFLTRDSMTDVYGIRADSTFIRLKETGWLGKVPESSSLYSQLGSLSPDIAGVITDSSGNIVAWPISLLISSFSVHRGYWQLVFGDIPLPATVNELLDDWILYEERLAEDYPLLDMEFGFDELALTRALVMNYIRTHGRSALSAASGTALKEALEKLKEIAGIRRKHGRIMTEWTPDEEDGHSSIIVLFSRRRPMYKSPEFYINTAENMVYGRSIFAYEDVPLIWGDGDTAEASADLSVLIINPNSGHPEEAVRYLECASSFDNDPYLYYALRPDMTEPYEKPGFQEKIAEMKQEAEQLKALLSQEDLEQEARFDLQAYLDHDLRTIENMDQLKWMISAETIAEERELLKNINLHTDNIFLTAMTSSDEVEQLCRQYVQGSLSADRFLQVLADKLSMIEIESR
ncbi:MAG: hypothetical protein IKH18_02975 [Clostridia bacterium]|nr:hypothetical protein [Clostridia bacterium]